MQYRSRVGSRAYLLLLVLGSRYSLTSGMTPEQAELERQRAEEQKKMEERSDELDAKDKEELLEQFKRDQVLRHIVRPLCL